MIQDVNILTYILCITKNTNYVAVFVVWHKEIVIKVEGRKVIMFCKRTLSFLYLNLHV